MLAASHNSFPAVIHESVCGSTGCERIVVIDSAVDKQLPVSAPVAHSEIVHNRPFAVPLKLELVGHRQPLYEIPAGSDLKHCSCGTLVCSSWSHEQFHFLHIR